MGTSAVVLVGSTEDNRNVLYTSWDGYPSGVGVMLQAALKDQFQNPDLDSLVPALQAYMDEEKHPYDVEPMSGGIQDAAEFVYHLSVDELNNLHLRCYSMGHHAWHPDEVYYEGTLEELDAEAADELAGV